MLPIYDALFHQPRLKHILVRHEQGADPAAEGYARSIGRPGVAPATSGPGAASLRRLHHQRLAVRGVGPLRR